MLLTIPSFARTPGGWIEYHVFVDTEYQAQFRESFFFDFLNFYKTWKGRSAIPTARKVISRLSKVV